MTFVDKDTAFDPNANHRREVAAPDTGGHRRAQAMIEMKPTAPHRYQRAIEFTVRACAVLAIAYLAFGCSH